MISCIVTSQKQTTVYKNLRSVTLPAFLGQMQILPGHIESFVLLKKGSIFLQQSNKSQKEINFLQNNQNKNIQIIGGECYIKNDVVTIIL